MKDWFLLINPFAAGGKTEKKKSEVFASLNRHGISFEAGESYSRAEAQKIIHEKIGQGFRRFISLGGDGTFNSLVNGIFTQREVPAGEMTMAIIPVGTGNDWIKTHGIRRSISHAVACIAKGRTVWHDVGLLTRTEPEPESRYFINVAGCAFQGFVAERIEGTINWMKIGPAAFYIGILEALWRYRATTITARISNQPVSGKYFNLSIGICRYAGGGMKLTPDAIADDGMFEITVAGDLKKREVIKNVFRLFNGSFIHHPKISQYKTNKIEVSSIPLAPIETDGEVFGYGNLDAVILEKAVQVIVP